MADGLFDQFKDWYEKRHDYARAWKARTGGQVVATMCTYTAEELLMALQSAARSSERFVQVLEQGGQSPDHPVHPAIPETRYLKTLFCRVTRD